MQQTDFSEAQQAWTLHWYQSHFVLYWQSKEWIWCHTQITKRKLNRKEHNNALPTRFLGGCNWEERYNWVGGVSTRHSSWDYSFKPLEMKYPQTMVCWSVVLCHYVRPWPFFFLLQTCRGLSCLSQEKETCSWTEDVPVEGRILIAKWPNYELGVSFKVKLWYFKRDKMSSIFCRHALALTSKLA